MFKQARNYQDEIIRVKEDVTYTEKQKEILKNLDEYNIRRANDWVDFDIDKDEEVAKITKPDDDGPSLTERMKEVKDDHLRRNVIILRDSLDASQAEQQSELNEAQ